MRIAVLGKEEAHLLPLALNNTALDLTTEKSIYRSAITYLQNQLKDYPSEEEAQAMLASDELNDNRRTAIRLRMQEKKILEDLIPMIYKAWEVILLRGELPGGIKY